MKHLFLTIFALVFAATDIQAQRIKGSDTVLPIAQQTAERFMTLNPNARVTVTGGGSGVGISALLDETTDIAMASRGIKFSEKMKELLALAKKKFGLEQSLYTNFSNIRLCVIWKVPINQLFNKNQNFISSDEYPNLFSLS